MYCNNLLNLYGLNHYVHSCILLYLYFRNEMISTSLVFKEFNDY